MQMNAKLIQKEQDGFISRKIMYSAAVQLLQYTDKIFPMSQRKGRQK